MREVEQRWQEDEEGETSDDMFRSVQTRHAYLAATFAPLKEMNINDESGGARE